MKRIMLFSIAICIMFGTAFCIADSANAQEAVCENATFSVVARDPGGSYISGISAEIYEQTEDADGLPKPGTKISGGKTSATTGYFSATIKNASGKKYAVKFNPLGKDATAFWYYNHQIDCGETAEASYFLSAINFIIRDGDGELLKNQAFSVYLQKTDADGKPIKEKSGLIASLNTGESGSNKAYLPAAGQTLSGAAQTYVFETIVSGTSFAYYGISANSGSLLEFDYTVSDLLLLISDSKGVYFPANEKIEIYQQEEDEDGTQKLGLKIKDVYTDDSGRALFAYPAGTYAARVSGADGTYAHFWDLSINDRRRTEYELVAGEDWSSGTGACAEASLFTLETKDLGYNFIPGLYYNLYEQDLDGNGLPEAGRKLAGGRIDEGGKGAITVHPDPRKVYALQIYQSSAAMGDFWFFNAAQFSCGQNISLTKQLPKIKAVFRDGKGALKKNQAFSAYRQKTDADGKPLLDKKEKPIASMNAGEKGELEFYLGPKHPYDSEKNGVYALSMQNADKIEFIEYGLEPTAESDLEIEYVFSGLAFKLKSPAGLPKKSAAIDIYERVSGSSGLVLGKKLKTLKTDNNGEAAFEYPKGQYAAAVKDDIGQQAVFWNITVKNRAYSAKDLIMNNTSISVKDVAGKSASNKTISVYSLKEGEDGGFYKDKKVGSLAMKDKSRIEASLAAGPYLLAASDGKSEYGQAFYAENGKPQRLEILLVSEQLVSADKKYALKKPESELLSERLKGRILLQAQDRGQAWYVDPDSGKRYYLKDGETAYELLFKKGLGISNADLAKLPIGLNKRSEEWDYDGDFVPDKMEEAIGTDPQNADTDGDGYDDGQEAQSGYDPLESGKKAAHDPRLAARLRGRILLQVEERGQAWYLNPADGRRYYLRDGESAYQIMKYLSLGITNDDLDTIEAEEL